jgi:hypothetical protein
MTSRITTIVKAETVVKCHTTMGTRKSIWIAWRRMEISRVITKLSVSTHTAQCTHLLALNRQTEVLIKKFPPLSLSLSLYSARTLRADWSGNHNHGQVHRQLSVSSDSKLLDDDIREEARVIMRPKKIPPRPKSEVFLNKHDSHPRRKRFSAFGVCIHVVMKKKTTTTTKKVVSHINYAFFLLLQGDSPFGKTEAYVKLEQLGEGSYATVFKGFSK